MWWILGSLLIGIAWALWYVLSLAMWIPVTTTVVIVGGVIALYLTRFVLRRRAAAQLEKAISAQATQQAMNARPERRAEIQELQRQLHDGISALKTSKLGSGGKSGAAALYSIPWYMIIGPPGAGKTTALKHSGLVFPYGSSSGGGVRGVGGTRNCDWWFTNEAILLDTAGRYTTENDDRDEWISFLQFLKKYRTKQPINGVMVAISVTDLVDASEQQIEQTGKKLRARIDEVMTRLQMSVPVYVLFTKVDLIAGFNEFFGDLRKSDRSQAWGCTLRLDMPKTEPAKIFDQEFDILLKQIHARGLKRMVFERSREAREKIYQFPLELAGLKRNLSELLAHTFAVNAFQGTPTFRGFYFTSGTQEGRPLDRVLGRMGQAMGIRIENEAQPVVESKSYFLHDVFMNVIFPDANVAARSAGEVRRQLLMRVAISAAALSLAAILAIPAINSYLNNRNFLRDTQERAEKVAAINWTDGKSGSGKFPEMKPLLERLKELDQHEAEGVPWDMGFWMYSGKKVSRQTLAVYVDSLQQGFAQPTKKRLEETLKKVSISAETYREARNALKMYMMLGTVEHLDVPWATGKYTAAWVEGLKATSDVSDAEMRELARAHVEYYFTLLKEGKVTPLTLDTDLIEKTRTGLQNVDPTQRYYEFFVNSLVDEKYDEAGDNSPENLVFPPLNLSNVFGGDQELLKLVESQRFRKEKRYFEIEGPYTDKGHAMVVSFLDGAVELLQQEAWVVPLTSREKNPDEVRRTINAVALQYEGKFMTAWEGFFKDIRAKSPTSPDEALDLYRVLSTTEYPYRRLLVTLENNTQWSSNPFEGKEGAARVLNQRLNTYVSSRAKNLKFGFDVRKMGEKDSVIPKKYKPMVSFGSGLQDTGVHKYAGILRRLRDKISLLKSQNPAMDLRQVTEELDAAKKEAGLLLATTDDLAKRLISPLLMDPLTIGTRENLVPRDQTTNPGDKPPTDKKTPPLPSGWSMPDPGNITMKQRGGGPK